MARPCRLFRRNRRATAAVEFAVVAPVFLLFVFGMIEYGRMVMVYQVLTNASREGARVAVLDGATNASVTAQVITYLNNGAVNGTVASVYTNPTNVTTAEFGDPITVTVEVPFNQVSWLPSPMYLGGKTLSSSTVMRRETIDD